MPLLRSWFATLVLSLLGAAASAQDARIAAVVNDQVISLTDLAARVQLVIASSNLPTDNDTRSRVASQVLRQMIDEKLELQEAKRENVTVDPAEVEESLAQIARGNRMSADQLGAFLAQRGIDKATLASEIEAQLIWQRLVQRRYGHQVSVGEDEIGEELVRIDQARDKPQNRLAEIFLAVESPQQDDEVHQLALRLFDELRRGTASFNQVARQFSQAPSAAQGGEIGWVLNGLLDPEVQSVVDQMAPGTLTRPLRMAGGYYLYYLVDRRTPDAADANVTLDLAQVVFPLAEIGDEAKRVDKVKEAEAATSDLRSCGEMNRLGEKTSPDLSGPINAVALTSLPTELRGLVAHADIARPAKAIAVKGGIGVFMVCKRTGGREKVSRQEVEGNLRSERMSNIARRYLDDLRRVAYIDLRV